MRGREAKVSRAAELPESFWFWVDKALGYVPSVARRYLGCGLPFEELLAAGNLGLVEAAIRYDPDRKVGFATYADWWIRKSILKAIEEQLGPVRLPRYRLEQLRGLEDTRRAWRSRHGRDPMPEELAGATGRSLEQVERLLGMKRQGVSLDQPSVPGSDRPFGETLAADAAQGPESVTIREDIAGRLRRILETLGAKDRQVLEFRFGLGGGAPMTLREVGHRLRISRERVRQIERRALLHLRRAL